MKKLHFTIVKNSDLSELEGYSMHCTESGCLRGSELARRLCHGGQRSTSAPASSQTTLPLNSKQLTAAISIPTLTQLCNDSAHLS